MFKGKIDVLKEKSIELALYLNQGEYEKFQIEIDEMFGIINEVFAAEQQAATQMKLVGIVKTLEDTLSALRNNDLDNAVLYISIHLPALLENVESTKEKEMLMEAFKEIEKQLIEIEEHKKKQLIEVREATKREYWQLIEDEVVTPENFVLRYKDLEDEEIQEIVEYVKNNQRIDIFNYEYTKKYEKKNVDVFYDKEVEMNYILFMEKKMYFPAKYSKDIIARYVKGILLEQDKKSPHCYEKEGYLVEEGDIVIDAGVAEGNFALSIIDKVKKIYIIECEEIWIKALRKTFEPYQDKVVFVQKFLSDKVDDNNITIDALLGNEEVNYIKMDIEGAERAALQGAVNTIKHNSRLTIAACAYHKRGDEKWIKDYLKEKGFETANTSGYMYFAYDERAYISLELRRGLVFGKKDNGKRDKD